MQSHFAPLLIFGVGLVAGLLAFWLGRWRSTCIFWMSTYPLQVPTAWRRGWVQVTTWVLVTVLSLIFATLWASLIIIHVNDWLGRFSWGALLVFRWQASGFAAASRYHKNKAELDNWMGKLNVESTGRPARSIEQLMGVSMTNMSVEELKAYNAHLKNLRK